MLSLRLAVFLFSFSFIAPHAYGQSLSSVAEAVRACQLIESDKERLACFDKIELPGPRVAAAPSKQERANQEPAKQAPPEPADPRDDFGSGDLKKPRQTEKQAPAPASPAEPKETTDPRDDFGSGDLKKPRTKNDDPQSITIGVIEAGKNRAGKAFFILENGHVWRQLKADTSTFRIPRDAAGRNVIIKKGWLGSHWLNFEGDRRRIKVERLK